MIFEPKVNNTLVLSMTAAEAVVFTLLVKAYTSLPCRLSDATLVSAVSWALRIIMRKKLVQCANICHSIVTTITKINYSYAWK